MNALVLGARAPACLEWARAFAAAGWRAIVADSQTWPLARFSRAAAAFVRLPEPRRDAAAWIEALDAAVRTHEVDLILPTCEEAFYLAAGRARLAGCCRVFVSDLSLMRALHHKGDFAAWTAGAPVQAPQTWLLRSPDEVAALAPQADELVFKPAYSRFATRTLLRPGAPALAALRPDASAPWVAQRFVEGREHCSYSILVDGRVTAHACYHPRHRVGTGSGIYFEPTDPSPVLDFVRHFGRSTGYTGQVGFDFIEAPDGRYHVLECNPRATSGVHLFDDRPSELVGALSGDGRTCTIASRHARMVKLAMLIFGAPRAAGRRAFWSDYARAKDVVQCAGDRNLLPGQLLGLAEVAARAVVRGRTLLAAATADIEWDGEAMVGS